MLALRDQSNQASTNDRRHSHGAKNDRLLDRFQSVGQAIKPLVNLLEFLPHLALRLIEAPINFVEAPIYLMEFFVNPVEAFVHALSELVKPLVRPALPHRLHAARLQIQMQLFVVVCKSSVPIQCRFCCSHLLA